MKNSLSAPAPCNIISGGETIYVMATVTPFVAIFNPFTSPLQWLGFENSDD